MAHTQLARVIRHAAVTHAAPRVALGSELRLHAVPRVLDAIRELLPSQPQRIELDGSGLRVMTEGARRVLLAATERLAALDVDLVITGCDPFEHG